MSTLHILCLEVIFVFFQMTMKLEVTFINILCLAIIFLKCSLFAKHAFYFLFVPITFKIVHTSVSIQNTKAYQAVSDSYKYFVVFLALVKITLVDTCMHIYCLCMNLRLSLYLHVCIIIYTVIVHSNRLYM